MYHCQNVMLAFRGQFYVAWMSCGDQRSLM